MNSLSPQLQVYGLVTRPLTFTFDQLRDLPADHQIADLNQLIPGRSGAAIRMDALLQLANADPAATHLGLHASRDDFHASVPIDVVKPRGLVLYAQDGQPLTEKQGGPFRFFIVDYASCRTEEIDECANVKFLDAIELTRGKGFDNRPHDEDEHAKLHAKESVD
jgi:DMSO/TMAO reductase YedYZ molybdopterin-dependent catalytic subunit